MSDTNWTPATTQQAIALWVGGKDVAEIAQEFGVAPGEILSRIAQAAIAGEDPSTTSGARPKAAAKSSEKGAQSKASAAKIPDRKSAAGAILASTPVAPKTLKARTPSSASTPPAADGPAKASAPTRLVSKKPVGETKPEAASAMVGEARAPAPQPRRSVIEAVPPAPRPTSLRLMPTPSPAADGAADAAPTVSRGYEAVALPAPVRTSKRLLVAADGGAGVPFMKATTLDCHFPLWADTETVSIERKRVCGCRALAGKSWCAHHLSAVFEPPRKPQPRVA